MCLASISATTLENLCWRLNQYIYLFRLINIGIQDSEVNKVLLLLQSTVNVGPEDEQGPPPYRFLTYEVFEV